MQSSPVTVREAASEFFGAFLLVFTIGCNVITGSDSWGALSIAAVLAVLVYALAPVSGAHLNPAVSVALGACGKCPWAKVGAYAVVQVLGGLCAGVAYKLAFSSGVEVEPTGDHFFWQAALAEMFYTCMLCLVVLNVAASKMHGGANQYYGLAIGGVIVAGAYSGGSISKGCFNPAVAIGVGSSAGKLAADLTLYNMGYVAFELLGAVLAAGIFRLCRPEDFNDTPAKDVAYSMTSKLAAEFVGTFFLMLTVGLDVVSGAKAAAVSIAAALSCMIFALGSVSGGHFNPAVTLAVLGAGREGAPSMQEAVAYAGTQIAAGVAASLTNLAIVGGEVFPLAPVKPYTWLQALPCEVTFTFLLAFVVLAVTAKAAPAGSQFAPLAIGLTIVCGGLACGHVSGGVLNPAVAAGVALTHAIMGGGVLGLAAWVPYALAQLLGGAIAAVAFRFFYSSEYKTPADARYGSCDTA